MSKKANMRQNSIITLTDHNKEEINKLKLQKEQIVKDFEEKKLGIFFCKLGLSRINFINLMFISKLFKIT